MNIFHHASALALSSIFLSFGALHAETVRILRVGDSITRMTATNPVLYDRLTEAGLEVVFVGSQ
jgi:hypothetical protein